MTWPHGNKWVYNIQTIQHQQPTMEKMMYDFSTVRPYVLNFLEANYWKVKNILSFDDAVGEAQLQFWRTIIRINNQGRTIENEKHLMSLFKTSWSRHFITLANKDTKSVALVEHDEATEMIEQTLVGELNNGGYAVCLIEKAPLEFKQVLGLMLKLPKEYINVIHGHIEMGAIDAANLIISNMLRRSPDDHLLHRVLDYLHDG